MLDKLKSIFEKDRRKKLVFFFDEDNSFHDELQEIESSGIQVISVNQNYFALKYQLEMELQGKEVFLYHPFPKPSNNELKKYPLLDLLKANHELRLDDVSEFLSHFGLQEHHTSLVKKYIKQLKTKSYQKKLTKILDPAQFSEANLKLGLIGIALGFHTVTDKNICLAKCLSTALDEKSFTKLIDNLVQLDLETDLLNWFNNLLDTKNQTLNKDSIIDFACRIKYNSITAYVENPDKQDTYQKLKLQRAADINRLQSFIQDWENNPLLKDQIELVFHELASNIHGMKLMEWYGDNHDFGYYSSAMLSNSIKELFRTVEINPVKIKDDSIKWLRNTSLSADQNIQIQFIYHTAGVYAILESYKSFKFNTPDDFIANYTSELHLVDYNYRKAIIEFDKVRDRLYEFEDEALQVFSKLNSKYDRFLIELNVEWQQVLNENNFNFHSINVDKQFDFYRNNLKDFDYKIAVIVSDALRYELGHDLYNDLMADSKNDLEIQPSLASIPSYTNLGMSNLLPNSGISVEKGANDLEFKIGDKSTVSTYRSAILQTENPESATIDYAEIIKFDRDKGRAFFSSNKVVYIYHDWIDAIGDKRRTEHQTFEATDKAKEDIKRLIKKIYGWNVYHVLVTSDHGFLFNYNDLEETSRESLPKAVGYTKDHVRFVVADDFEGKVDGYQLKLADTTNIKTDLKVAIPRAINRYRKQGNIGLQFVHGGASLQELLTPVIKFYKQKKETNQTVSFKRIDQTDKITSGSLKVTLIQDQPVSNEFKNLELILGIYSENGEPLTNEVELNLNSTSMNPKERFFEVILSLNSKGSKASFGYLKAFDKNEKSRLNPIVLNDLIKINSLMEKDEF